MFNETKNLGDGSALASEPRGLAVPYGLIVLGLPIIASMISRTAMSFVDFIMVSQLGTDAQAAIMPAGIILFCVIAFGMGVLSVVNTFVAQSLGRGDKGNCAAYAWQGVYLSVFLGVLMLPGWWLATPFFQWVGHEPQVSEMEAVYVQIGVLGVAPTLVCVALSNFFNGVHRPVIGFWAALIGNIFNVLANYALIFGKWGFPAMGIAGAAWGTLISAVLQMIVLLIWFTRGWSKREYDSLHHWRVALKKMWQIVTVGFPAGVQFMMDIIVFTIFTLFLIGRFGTEQLAANNLTFKCLEVSFMPVVGMGVALTAAVGKSIGEKRICLARIQSRWVCGMGVGYMGMIAIALIFFNEQFADLLTDDPEVIHWASRMLIVCAIFQVFDAVGITYSSALRGAGDTLVPAVMMVVFGGVVFMGGGFAIAHYYPGLQSIGPWSAATAYIIVLSTGFAVRFWLGHWERLNILDERVDVPLP
ncbi:MATE family efflux transporter [Poriferisphaera sp. WC338]|uniref:MATE family efflux transporter n=1 Tax=Poriferisphaera sp. WC338 TaxID=3425129 RepID=UPI003D819CB6